jgi:hypothetical protein
MKIFNNLFTRKQTEANSLEINIIESGISINKQSFTFPIAFLDLENILGKPRTKITENNIIHTWDDMGIYVYSKDRINIFELAIQIIKYKDWIFLPLKSFSGKLTVDGENYISFIKIAKKDYGFKDFRIGENEICAQLTEDSNNKQIFLLSIYEMEKIQKVNSEKYNYKKINGEKIEFNDFNFKLAVIQELMYTKELLKPKFNNYEFIEKYDKRNININEEGYKPIPEIVEYFKNLEIDKNLANEITEIYQDGGNEIYMNLYPFWNGEDGIFDIQSYDDVDLFPNLKKMTLMCSDKSVFKELKEKGIDAQQL